MNFNLVEVSANCENNFDDKFYDSILYIAIALYDKTRVKFSVYNRTIDIKDKVNISLSLSSNESKVYVHTYIGDSEEIRRQNFTFRLFSLEEVKNYLLIKKQENEFIRENEG